MTVFFVFQLQYIQAARLGILPAGRGKSMSTQIRGRGRGRGGRGRGSLNHMVVDHRPKTISVSGFYEKEKEELLQYFSVSNTCHMISQMRKLWFTSFSSCFI